LQSRPLDAVIHDGDTFQRAHQPDYDDPVKEPRIPIPEPILRGGVIAIGRGIDPDAAVRIGEGLRAGGVGALEVTMGSDGALTAIERLAARFGENDFVIGAGTVLDVSSAAAAVGAGATFLVMPVTDPVLIGWAAARAVPTFPGAMTPSEALAGWTAGASAIKVFPASVVGPAFVRELRGPFPEIPLVPTGGLTVGNVPEFIAAGAVAVGLGSWLTGEGDPERIAQRGRQVVAAIRAARGDGRAA
jgi:2-dehydro-3-deoxyphosphogluconate aldolase/(4S)-4-hydroxy-2-oxoglutarate aldolase